MTQILFPFKAELSFMTFEGQQIQGAPKILEKLQVCCVRGNYFLLFSYQIVTVKTSLFRA